MPEQLYDAVCIGTCLLDIATSGLDFDTFLVTEPNLADAIEYNVGGDAVNEATILAKLGYRSCLMSRVGNDFVGRFLLDQIVAAGVEVSHVQVDSAVPTAANNILIGQNDKRVYTISRNETSRTALCEADIRHEVIRRARVVSVGSLFVHPLLDEAALYRVFRSAKSAGAITCADVCPSGVECSLEQFREALPYLDYLFANESEARYLSGKSTPDEMADYFLHLGIDTAVIKLGGKGSYIHNRQERFYCDAFPVKAVDTTGAGDCYAAGFISGLLQGLPLKQCAEFASATGALTVQSVGATAGIRDMEQVSDFILRRRTATDSPIEA